MNGSVKSTLCKRALNLSYFTIIYNVVEGILSIFARLIAGSTSLLGFGLDSVVESLSGTVLVWRIRKTGKISEKYIRYTSLILGIIELIKKPLNHQPPNTVFTT